jgi:hypothetical protein
MKPDLPHLTSSPILAAPHPHTPERGGGAADSMPHLPNLCRTSGAAGAAHGEQTVSLATFLKLRRQLREERRLRMQAEADRDAIKAGLGGALEGVNDGTSGK